jgi:ribose/xylose/arabinose/galactoside ABC-type transport system permease subunit
VTLFVVATGVLSLGVGLTMLASPAHMRRGLDKAITRRMLPIISMVRIGIGIALVLTAPSTRLPAFIWALGLLVILRGVALPMVGFARSRKLADWWMAKPDRTIRGWSLLVILLGALLLWAGT